MPTESQQMLERLYPARLALTPDQLAPLLSTTAHRIRLAIQEGWWPIPHRRVGRRILFPVPLIAGYLDGNADEVHAQPPLKAGPGRPRKKAPAREPGKQ